jgi:phage gp29-like protein
MNIRDKAIQLLSKNKPIDDTGGKGVTNPPFGAMATVNNAFFGISNYVMENPDEVLKKEHLTLEAYRSLRYDGHVYGVWQSRKSATLKLLWDVNRGKEKDSVAQFMKDLLIKLKIRDILSDILEAPYYGYYPLEVIWNIVDDYLVPTAVLGKPPWWFEYDSDKQLRFKNYGASGGTTSVPQFKFLNVQFNATYENPHGDAIASKMFYPTLFKRGATKLLAIYTERYGMPFLKGTVISDGTGARAREMYKLLLGLKQNGVLVTEEDDVVEFLNANVGPSGGGQLYIDFISLCNSEISKPVLSETLTTEQSGTGSYAMANTHFQVRQDVVDSDKLLCQYWVNKLIQWVYIFNFGSSTDDIPYFELYAEQDVDMNLSQRDLNLANTKQLQFTKKYFTGAYGFKDDEIEIVPIAQPAPPQTPPAQFSEGNGNNADLSRFDKLAQAVITPVLEMVSKKTEFSEIQKSLVKMFPKLDTADLEEYIAQGLVVAQASGMIDVMNKK